MTSRIITNEWSLFLEADQVYIKTLSENHLIVKAKYIRPGGWRIYITQTDYILATLSDHVRFETDPTFIINHPDTINLFFKTHLISF
ncbi:MAG TPA: hypothetical protein PKD85_00580 [Saprospiraceae bacterium]|nr:hypothetical protein [Saprospiraceae bacterium]